MKKIFTNALMALVAIFCCGLSVEAQEYQTEILSVPSAIDLNEDGTAIIPISLNNTVAVAAISIELTANGVEFGEPQYTDRLDAVTIKEFRNNLLAIVGTDDDCIEPVADGEDAVIVNLPVSIKQGNSAQSIKVTLKGTYTPAGSDYTDVRYKSVSTSLNLVKYYPLDVPASLVYTVGEPLKVSVGLDNDFTAGAITVRFSLPEGVKLNSNTATKGDRVTSGTSVSKIKASATGLYSVNLMNLSGSTLTGNSGEFLSFEVVAEQTLAEGAAIDWTGTEISNIDADLFMAAANPTVLMPSSVLEDVKAQYDEDVALIDEMKAALADFDAEAAESYAGYLVVKAEEIQAVKATVDQLAAQADAAYAQAQKTGVYNGPAKSDIMDTTYALMALSTGVEEWKAGIEEAARPDLEKLMAIYEMTDLETLLESDNEAVAEKAYNCLAALLGMYKEVENAEIKAIKETGVYESPVTEEALETAKADMESLIALCSALEGAETEYNEDMALIDEMKAAVADFEAEAAANFAGYLVVKAEEIQTVKAAVDQLAVQADAAYAEAQTTGVYNGPAQSEIMDATYALMALSTGVEEWKAGIAEAAMADLEKLQEIYEIVDLETLIESENTEIADQAYNCLAALLGMYKEVEDAQVKAIKETGVYESPVTEEILEKLTSDMESLNETSGINSIADDTEARYFNVNGVEISNPVTGSMYIKVVNGKASKYIAR